MKLWCLLLAFAWVAVASGTAHAKQLAIVADTANSTTNLTSAELVKIFNAHTRIWPDGKPITIVLRDPSSADMQLILRRVFNMTVDEARTFIHTHAGTIVVADSDEAVQRFVANIRGATISRMIRMLFAVSLLLSAGTVAAQTSRRVDVLPLTTKSQEVRRLVEKAWDLDLDQVEQEQAIEVLRKALKIDPNFAMGHELLSQTSLDPAEQVREQQKAFANRSHASAAERLVIEWLQDAADHKLIPAITKMNDVLSRYPHDKWVVFLANWWLTQQTQYDRAIAVFENSGLDSPGLMNNVAYTYAYTRQFEKSFALMDKYVAALPKDPNPQDSYAEILRMAGRFDQAIEHYRAALTLDPGFYSSQFGIADTYSLMGDQVRARQEYEIGFKKFSLPELLRIQWQTREAITFVREG